MKREIGISIGQLQNKYGDKRAIEIASEIGYDTVDFNFDTIKCDYRDQNSFYSKSDDEIISYYTDLRKFAEEKGIRIHQTHGTGGGFVNDAEKDAALIKNNRIDCMASAALGAGICVVHNPTTMSFTPDVDAELMRRLSYEQLKGMVCNAKYYGLKIASETFGDAVKFDCVDFFGDINEFEMSCNRIINDPELTDNFTVCIDTGHSNKAMRYGNPKPGDVIRRMGSNVTVLHLHDNDTLTDQHKIPMTGCIDWQDVFSALDEIGYSGVYNMELNLPHFGDNFLVETAEFAYKVMRNMLKDRYGNI